MKTYKKKIQDIIDNAPTKREALQTLETLRIFGSLNDIEYLKARKEIKKEFENE